MAHALYKDGLLEVLDCITAREYCQDEENDEDNPRSANEVTML